MKALILALLLWPSAALTQTDKTPVAFDCKCSDAAAVLYAAAFRDQLAANPRYFESSNLPQGWHVDVVSMDLKLGPAGNNTVLSVAIAHGESFFNHAVQSCNRTAAQLCAEQAIAFMDNAITTHR